MCQSLTQKGVHTVKEILVKRLANLLSVKSIVTLVMMVTFCYLTVKGTGNEDFTYIFTTIMGFYFGYQSKTEEAPK